MKLRVESKLKLKSYSSNRNDEISNCTFKHRAEDDVLAVELGAGAGAGGDQEFHIVIIRIQFEFVFIVVLRKAERDDAASRVR